MQIGRESFSHQTGHGEKCICVLRVCEDINTHSASVNFQVKRMVLSDPPVCWSCMVSTMDSRGNRRLLVSCSSEVHQKAFDMETPLTRLVLDAD